MGNIDPELRVEMEIPQPLIQSTFSNFIESQATGLIINNRDLDYSHRALITRSLPFLSGLTSVTHSSSCTPSPTKLTGLGFFTDLGFGVVHGMSKFPSSGYEETQLWQINLLHT